MQIGKTYCYKMIQNVINTVLIDSLVNPVRKAQFKSLSKKQEVSRARGWKDTEEIQDYNRLLWTSNPGGKIVSSPFISPDFLCLCYVLARKMKFLFPLSLLFIVLWLQKLTVSCNENCHWKHYNIMSNHTMKYFGIMSNCLLWKMRGFSYKRIADMLNMVFILYPFLVFSIPLNNPAASHQQEGFTQPC